MVPCDRYQGSSCTSLLEAGKEAVVEVEKGDDDAAVKGAAAGTGG